ncbi:hypothetical protein FOA52_014685 [Chlamydomonas sp. UWO 241]|nr:hypothetical protein FOA52_014685 [Chlamydomonas sp. UWO 241]
MRCSFSACQDAPPWQLTAISISLSSLHDAQVTAAGSTGATACAPERALSATSESAQLRLNTCVPAIVAAASSIIRNANKPLLSFACNLLECGAPGLEDALHDRTINLLSKIILTGEGAGRSGQQQAGGSAAALDDSQLTPGGDSQPDMLLMHDPWAEPSSTRQLRGH